MASAFSGESVERRGSKPHRASWSTSLAVNSSLTIQPVGSFQLVQRSPRTGLGELRPHRCPEGRVAVAIEVDAEQDGHRKRLADDVLALGEDGSFEARDVLDARTEELGDLFGGQACADVRLDLARAGSFCGAIVAVAFATHLAQLGAQHVVDREREALARLGRENDRFVLGSDHLELFHANRPSRSSRVAPMLTQHVGADREYPGRAASFTGRTVNIGRERICEMRRGRANYRRPQGQVPQGSPGSRDVYAWLPITTPPARPKTTASRSRLSRSVSPTRCRARSDVEDADNPSGFELPGADLSDLELDVVVLPPQEDEFTCVNCFLVKHRSQLDHETQGRPYVRGVRRVALSPPHRRREAVRRPRSRAPTRVPDRRGPRPESMTTRRSRRG